MRNLLLQNDKKSILKEYKLRIIIIISIAILLTTLIAMILLLPSYILSNLKYRTVEEHAEIIKNSIEKREQGESGLILSDTQKKLELLSMLEDDTLLSEIFKKALNEKPLGVKIGELSYRKKQDESGEITVLGVSSGRESLLQFKRDLEKENIFLEVTLPVSNLASDKDIVFSLTITGKF